MVSSSTRQRPAACGSRARAQEPGPHGAPVWAMSPTTVIERLGLRRISIRQAIGDSSWASSTMTWPNTQPRSWLARSASPAWGPAGAPAAGQHRRVEGAGVGGVAGGVADRGAGQDLAGIGQLGPVLLGLAGLGPPRPGPVVAEQHRRLVQQGHVGRGPAGVAAVGGRARQQGPLGRLEPAAGRGQALGGGEQAADELLGGQLGPQPVDRRADRRGGASSARISSRSGSSRRSSGNRSTSRSSSWAGRPRAGRGSGRPPSGR